MAERKEHRFDVEDGSIMGRNGYKNVPKMQILLTGGLAFLDAIGVSGKIINGGLTMDADDFVNNAVKVLPDDTLIKELRARNYALSIWEPDDVKHQAIDLCTILTDTEVENICGNLDHYHDATIGINWDVITVHIQDTDREYKGGDAVIECGVEFTDDRTTQHVLIAVGNKEHIINSGDYTDDDIFFYVDDEDGFTNLQSSYNSEDFQVINVQEIINL